MDISCCPVMAARDVLITILAFVAGMYTALITQAWIDMRHRQAIQRQIELERLQQVTGG